MVKDVMAPERIARSPATTKGRIYVAGPITRLEKEGWSLEEIRDKFDDVSERLRLDGWEPVNPFDLHPTGVSWEAALAADIQGLVTCTAIYLQKRYSESRGAMLELHIARELGFRELYEDRPETVCQEAERIVVGDRGPQYGPPTKNFEQTAELWKAYTGYTFTPEQVAGMMILLKLSRQSTRAKRDNVVDIIGYAKTMSMVLGYE